MNQEQAQQDLAYIRELMRSTRHATYVSGAYYIVWAFAAGFGQLGTWLIVSEKLSLPFQHGISMLCLWTAVSILGGIGTGFLIKRDMKATVRNPAGRLIGLSWFAVCIGLLIIFFVGFGFGSFPGHLITAISALFIGIGVFNTGVLTDLKWLRNLAFGWWLGGALMLASPGLWNLWFMALLLFALYLIPGIVLSRQLKN